MRRGGQRHGGRGGGGGGGGSSSLPLPSGALTAAALQDELMRRFQGAPTRAPRRRKAPPRRRPPPRPESPPQDELTLAQRLGLVERPPPRLSAAEWQAVYEASRARGDPLAMCPICRCDFGGDAQQQGAGETPLQGVRIASERCVRVLRRRCKLTRLPVAGRCDCSAALVLARLPSRMPNVV